MNKTNQKMILSMYFIKTLMDISKSVDDKERKEMQQMLAKSDFIEGLIKAAQTYTEILSQKELQWIIDNNINGQGGKIMEKIVKNFDKIVVAIRAFEKESEC